MSSLYIHIPFCISKCFYCSFSSFQGLENLYDRYCRALGIDISTSYPAMHGTPLETLFLGGGTPTVLKPDKLVEILNHCRRVYGLLPGAEVSLEANPGTVDFSALKLLYDAGFNRLSIGVQSFNDNDLQVLGRTHTSDQSLQAVREARRAGFENISLDLMYGLPGQTVTSWQKSLEQALILEPEHLSLYQLTLEEDTAFFKRAENNQLCLPGEEQTLAMDDLSEDVCSAAGFDHYEIANYAGTGFKCRHNLVYWLNNEYLACGAGAVSYYRGTRNRIISNPLEYCLSLENNTNIIEESEKLGHEAAFRESVVIGLRLLEGVRKRRLFDRFGLGFDEVYGKVIEKLVNDGLLEQDETHLRLSPKGMNLANLVMAELV